MSAQKQLWLFIAQRAYELHPVLLRFVHTRLWCKAGCMLLLLQLNLCIETESACIVAGIFVVAFLLLIDPIGWDVCVASITGGARGYILQIGFGCD